MMDHALRINIDDEIHNNIDPDENFTSEEMREIADKAVEYISADETFWNAFNSCVSDAIIYVKHRRNKIDE